MSPARTRPRRNSRRPAMPFDRRLVLHQWMLSLLGQTRFEDLAQHLRDERLEGLDDHNVHRFCHELLIRIPSEDRPELPDDVLLAYDQNIVRHTQRLNERRLLHREAPLSWKYFQYLALLFTEIYLDRYFRDPEALLAALNGYIHHFNAECPEADRVGTFDPQADAAEQLNKLAFWMATGSGKTLVMHANILQYRHWLGIHGRARDLNRIILLTPNEGLSQQHLRELEAAGIHAELFSKEGRGLFVGRVVEIIDIHKLREEMGEKTVAVDAFEGNNLVMVDEGHRGASGGEVGKWMDRRNALCAGGFSFEYSATFAQAVKGNASLSDTYAKSILFDYSYRYFYNDGFGKDYHIANLQGDSDREWMDTYLTACLLTFYQQLRLYRDQRSVLRPFNIEKPLWVFVGGSVNAVRSERGHQVSDVVAILGFVTRYLADRRASTDRIRRVLNEGLLTAQGKNLFAGRFAYLNTAGLTADAVFLDTLALVFNAPAGGALHLENLKSASGEISLRVGDNEPFGLINVGDDAKLAKLCRDQHIDVSDREFSGSLFQGLNDDGCAINLLIGSRKFTEGWNSWRVSTMGLMNIGRGEGAQIIQLFGRGVRLKGYDMSLKRSTRAALPPEVKPPRHITDLETLSIFGVRADYMAQFQDYLREEGLPTEDVVQFVLPVVSDLGDGRLKTVRLEKEISGARTDFGDVFRRLGPIPTVQPPDPQQREEDRWLQENPVVLNWYPKVQALKSRGETEGELGAPEEGKLTPGHIALLDFDRLFFELRRFKAERGRHNLNLTRVGVRALLDDHTWYRLQIPHAQLAFDSMAKVTLWQEIAGALLKKYVEHYYTFRKRAWELPHLECQPLASDDPNLPRPPLSEFDQETEIVPADGYYYRILVKESEEELLAKLEELRKCIEDRRASGGTAGSEPWEFQGLRATWAANHLYHPLLCLKDGSVDIAPPPLNKDEERFVRDLSAFVQVEQTKAGGGFFGGRQLYLLRNLSRGHGVGFMEGGGFYPDFILWLLEGATQHIVFVDPKGLRQLGRTHAKVRFHERVRDVEQRLGDPDVRLHSFLVSNTPAHVLTAQWGMSKAEIEALGIVFQEDGGYVGRLLARVVEEGE